MRAQPSLIITGANPGAGAEYVYTCTNITRRLRSFYGVLSASAAVATRTPSLTFVDPGNQHLFLSPLMPGITASQFAAFQWHVGWPLVSAAISNTSALAPLPDFRLPAGSKIQTSTPGLQAGDTWTFIRLVFE